MESTNDCDEFRQDFDSLCAGDLSAPHAERLRMHVRTCGNCHQWQQEMNAIGVGVRNMPQFDVSEQLTQSILSAVEKEQKVSLLGQYGLLIPVATVCIAALIAIVPMDTVEGFLSTLVAFAGVFIVKLLVSGARSEEAVA